MAIFSKKTKKTNVKVTKAGSTTKKVRDITPTIQSRAAMVLIAPWVSEKALIGTEKGVYVFSIARFATKIDVMRAIEAVYKVTPRQVRIVNLPGRRVSRRTRAGVATRARRRKAYVYLKSGDTIQVV